MLHMGLKPVVITVRLLVQLLVVMQLALPAALLPMLILESIFDLYNTDLNDIGLSCLSKVWRW